MPGVKITDLDNLVDIADEDVILIVDVDEDVTNKITIQDLFKDVAQAEVAELASKVLIDSAVDSGDYYLLLGQEVGTYDSVQADTELLYNSITQTLTAGNFKGDGSQLIAVKADSAAVATTALEALRADIADSATEALNARFAVEADSAYHALSADSAINATLANTALFALNASQADSAAVATLALTANLADLALSADSATIASSALVANLATNALFADSATNATFAVNATLAQIAGFADSAAVSARAITADSAYHSLFSDSATLATTALVANRSLGDLQNVIDSATGARVLGDLTIDSDLFVLGNANITGDITANIFTGDGSGLTNITATTTALATDQIDSKIIDSSGVFFIPLKPHITGYDSVSVTSALTYDRVLGDLTIDSDLFVLGNTNITGDITANLFTGDGSGLTNITATTTALATDQIDSKIIDSSGVFFIPLKPHITGYDSVSVTSDLTYDPSNQTLSSVKFSGDGTSISNVAAVSATNASNVEITQVGDDAVYYLHIGSTTAGNDNVNVSLDLTYNPASNTLTTDRFDTGTWEVYESAGSLLFEHNGTKKMRLDSDGNLAITGTLAQSQTL